MSDITREEMTARLEALDARSEARFERLSREIAEVRASSIGKTSFFFGLIALFGAIVTTLALGPAWIGTGLSIRPIVDASVRDAVAQSLHK